MACGLGSMPQETRNYVAAITGNTVDAWAAAGKMAGCRQCTDHELP